MIKNILVLSFLLSFLGVNISYAAKVVNKEQESQLVDLIKNFNYESNNRDIDALVNYIPPHLITAMSLRLGKTNESLADDFKSSLSSQIKVDSSSKYLLDASNIKYSVSADGQIYALIGTERSNAKVKVLSQTLAIYENSKWYLVYGGARAVQNPIFSMIYPSLSEIKFSLEKVIRK